MSVRRARQLRKHPTEAERALWQALRNKQLAGRKFRRQVPIGPYIIDFACMEAKLIVELDGGQHATQRERDVARNTWLSKQGYRVLRFWNNEVLENRNGVLRAILAAF